MGRHAAPGAPDDNPRPRGPVPDPFGRVPVGEPFARIVLPAPETDARPAAVQAGAGRLAPGQVTPAQGAAPTAAAQPPTSVVPPQHATTTAPPAQLTWRAALVLGVVAGLSTAGVLVWVGTTTATAVAAAVGAPAVVLAAVWLTRRLPGHH